MHINIWVLRTEFNTKVYQGKEGNNFSKGDISVGISRHQLAMLVAPYLYVSKGNRLSFPVVISLSYNETCMFLYY